MVSMICSWKNPTPVNLPTWVVNKEQLRSRCLDNSGVFSQEALSNCVSTVVKSNLNQKDLNAFADKLAEAISIGDIEKNFPNLLREAKALGRYHVHKDNQGYLEYMMQAFFNRLELLLEVTGILDFLRPADQKCFGPKDTEARKNSLSIASTLAGIVAPAVGALGPIYGGAASVAIVATLFIAGLTHPRWKSFPTGVLGVENWSQKLVEGSLDVGYQRKEIVEKIADLLSAKIPVLVVGEPGVGKTQVLKALTLAIANGDYPELSNTQVNVVNTPDVSEMGESIAASKPPAYHISDRFKDFRDNTILVLDRIDRAHDQDSRARITDQLGKMLDSPDAHFPYFIGVTTNKGLETMKSEAGELLSHFEQVEVKTPSGAEILSILKNRVENYFPDILIEDDVLEYLQKNAPKKSVRDLDYALRKCIRLVSKTRSKNTELMQARKGLIQLRKNLKSTAEDPSFERSEKLQKQYYVLKEAVLPRLEEELKAKALESGVKLWIDRSVVDEVLGQYQFKFTQEDLDKLYGKGYIPQ